MGQDRVAAAGAMAAATAGSGFAMGRLLGRLADDAGLPGHCSKGQAEGGTISWGNGTGLRSDEVRGRGYAPRGWMPEVRVSHKRLGHGLISAVANRGELRWMILDGALKALGLLRILPRPGSGCGQQGLPHPRPPAAPPGRQGPRLAGRGCAPARA
jgi:hypothetical protein